MPKKPINYSKTIMYKFVSKDLTIDENYVGHTTDFNKRRCVHKYDCNNPNNKKYNQKIYKFIRENGGWDNFSMIKIEDYPCKDRLEAASRERYWYEQLNSKLNTNIPGRTYAENQIEYRKKNKIKLNILCKNWNDENKKYFQNRYLEKKDEINKRHNEKHNCECGGTYTTANKAQHIKRPIHINNI